MIKYDSTKVSHQMMVDALLFAGLDLTTTYEIARDFRSDRWWSDPKEIGRRIRMEGGDHIKFYDFFKAHGYEFN